MYCTIDDIKTKIHLRTLIQLAGEGEPGEPDLSKVLSAIRAGDSEIDGAVGRNYSLPLSEIPGRLVEYSAILAIGQLYTLREIDTPKSRAAQMKTVRASLADIAAGDEVLFPSETGEKGDGPAASRTRSDRVFSIGGNGSRGTLDNY